MTEMDDVESSKSLRGRLSHAFRDYGMIVVLLLLVGLFSLLTIAPQHPQGAEAGRQVAREILARSDAAPQVILVAQETEEDRAFLAAARELLEANGGSVVAEVSGNPVEARQTVTQLLQQDAPIDALALTDVTVKWTLFDRLPGLEDVVRFSPQSYRWPNFLKTSNLLGIANQAAIYAIIAIGMTMVIISAGIDLSVGSLVALAAVTSTLVIREWGGGTSASLTSVACGCLAGVLICTVAGTINGICVARFQVPPFIATLAMMMIASGLAYRLSNGRSIDAVPPAFQSLDGGRWLGIPNAILFMLVLFIVAQAVMSRTIFGRYVYAVGGNYEAARLSGVPVRRVQFMVYSLCGSLAGFVGVLLASRLASGAPTFGLMYELDVIAAVVVGGCSLMGGQGKMFGTLIGALIIMTIKNGMNLTNIDSFNQKIVLGVVLLLAVLIDLLKRRKTA